LLPRLTATLGARTLLGLIAVTVLGTLLLLLAATGGPLALIGVAIAILGAALTLVGVPITILGTALTLVGVPVAILRTLPLVGVPITILGALTIVTVTAIGRALLRSCSTRWIVAQAALLARTERTRRGYVPLRPDLGARLPNGRLRTEALTTQVLLAHHDRTPNPGGANQHARLNLIGPQRSAD
jgi:hypothetical protein